MTSGAGTLDEAQEAYPRIQRRTLHDEVLERMRDMIIEGTLAPGQRINEGLIGAQLGVSRTPLREAIKTLASEGLVEIQPAKGAIVRKFSSTDMRHILEVLKSLEQLGGRMACENASDETIAAIRALHDEMMEQYRVRNRLEYFKLNQAIHSAIVAASGNDVLVEMHGTLQARIKRLRFIGNEGPEKWAGAVAEHETMIESLEKRDVDALMEVIRLHMDSTRLRVWDVL
ncbi:MULTISPECIES: GntR family transcriptional regulator [Bosea]|jgi:DNA-binding GntR family transcriptional regulator|uniref:GntR family transcriptional regulator n=1 Tax=Bosea rubneri TaxID=3075434 RepID=A0ABU3SCY0_9HYPH|nr:MULTISPECIES: GntR family transcriptional regulator [unclassified Bosea (in: a-proteobacteria)]MDU0342252.1 GntR family transcriptional regulator [Bosea sp. ZW T0_25]HEV7338129.1 GntR family transcriptional regulator [Bosea sp. (in: a-proteobacteria)]